MYLARRKKVSNFYPSSYIWVVNLHFASFICNYIKVFFLFFLKLPERKIFIAGKLEA